ncbi:hypothetical protein BpHYR1_050303 [Brachionus plicatilis]|uniref:Uncharacterized protein n=1 Tax=Brachionus plicatilis TaxID=10195 RepID=A0A3M7R493_BRAPC|nr:hypothetical protein BpHYR1_050303 [Brachionus plicatilis]
MRRLPSNPCYNDINKKTRSLNLPRVYTQKSDSKAALKNKIYESVSYLGADVISICSDVCVIVGSIEGGDEIVWVGSG